MIAEQFVVLHCLCNLCIQPRSSPDGGWRRAARRGGSADLSSISSSDTRCVTDGSWREKRGRKLKLIPVRSRTWCKWSSRIISYNLFLFLNNIWEYKKSVYQCSSVIWIFLASDMKIWKTSPLKDEPGGHIDRQKLRISNIHLLFYSKKDLQYSNVWRKIVKLCGSILLFMIRTMILLRRGIHKICIQKLNILLHGQLDKHSECWGLWS